jgi:hypothetical protein
VLHCRFRFTPCTLPRPLAAPGLLALMSLYVRRSRSSPPHTLELSCDQDLGVTIKKVKPHDLAIMGFR